MTKYKITIKILIAVEFGVDIAFKRIIFMLFYSS